MYWRTLSAGASIYNEQEARWSQSDRKKSVDSFVEYDESKISWSRDLKLDLKRGHRLEFSHSKIREALYRPFFRTNLYFDRILNEEVYRLPKVFPSDEQSSNTVIVATIDKQIDFSALAVSCIPCVHLGGRPSQCFPFYTYDEDNTNRRENITD
jgi:predicted helicase